MAHFHESSVAQYHPSLFGQGALSGHGEPRWLERPQSQDHNWSRAKIQFQTPNSSKTLGIHDRREIAPQGASERPWAFQRNGSSRRPLVQEKDREWISSARTASQPRTTNPHILYCRWGLSRPLSIGTLPMFSALADCSRPTHV